MSDNTIIGADYCPYCVKVKKYFQEKSIPFKWIDSETPDGEQRRKQQSKKHNWNTIPMVFIDGKFVGGCDDFFKALKEGKINLPKL